MKRIIIIIFILSILVVDKEAKALTYYNYYRDHVENKEEYDIAYKLAFKLKPIDFQYDCIVSSPNVSRSAYFYVCYDWPQILWSPAYYTGFRAPYTDNELLQYDYDWYYAYINDARVKIGNMKKTKSLKKIKKIHDYVSKRIKYKSSQDDSTRSIGRVLITGKGCCVSYAKLFKLLCDYYDIKSIYIANDDHAFNYVYYKKKWYGIDCCWDKNGDKEWFMYTRSKEKTSPEHKPELWFDKNFKFPKLAKKRPSK